MNLKAYFVSSDHCGHCDKALDALRSVHGDKWESLMEIIEIYDDLARENRVDRTPTLIVVDTEDDNKLIAKVGGSNNLTESFWSQFFTSVK